MNAALKTIPTGTITETNKLIHSTATVIMEMLWYKVGSGHNKQCPPWKRQLEAKIKATRREVSQLAELQKGKMVTNSSGHPAEEIQQMSWVTSSCMPEASEK